jgi:hypothetical protein
MEHKHKYLLEVFDEKDIPFPFNAAEYPQFDGRDTYNLDFTLVCWLYERLRFFQEETCIKLDCHKFDIDGEILTQAQCIQRMIDDCKVIMTGDIWTDEETMTPAKDDLFKVLSEVYWAMWW